MEENIWTVIIMAIITVATVAVMLGKLGRWPETPKDAIQWPPGPRKLPIIGNLYQVIRGWSTIHQTLAKLAQVHGNVMTVWFGSNNPVIVVTGRDSVWEVLVSKSSDYAARQITLIPTLIDGAFCFIVNTDSYIPRWNSLRKGLTNGAFAPFTLSAQARLQETDIAALIQSLREEASCNEGVVRPFPHLKRAAIMLLSRLIFGPDFNDEVFVCKIDLLVEEMVHISSKVGFSLAFFSFFGRYVPNFKTTTAKITADMHHKMSDIVSPCLVSSSSSPPPPNSYLHFLRSQNLPEKDIIAAIMEVFLLGIDSTSSTTLWGLAFLVREQQVQDKLYEEINKTVTDGGSGMVVAEDVSKMHYLQAIVKETIRMKPVAPLAVIHKAGRDTQLREYKIAKGTPVVVNLYARHYDPKVWPHPDRFMPERFLPSASSLTESQQRSFLPFGAGLRVCAGMEVGKLQIALALANLVRSFHWVPAVEGQLPDITEQISPLNILIQMKTPLSARIIPRF